MNEQKQVALLERYGEAVMRINACLTETPDLAQTLVGRWANGSLLAQVVHLEAFIEKDCRFSYDTFWPMHTRIVMTLIFATLSLIGIVGNLLIILVVFRVRGMVSHFGG
jgi:hypothetical protein